MLVGVLDSTEIPAFGSDFRPTDFVKPAEASGAAAWLCATADEFSQRFTQALTLQLPSVIVVPIDYSVDMAISREPGTETVATRGRA
jgi:acetolactate synthase-1/2/3 large subunit